MDKLTSKKRIYKIIKRVIIVFLIIFVFALVVRAIYLAKQEKINEQVEKIHSTKLALADVMGENLPPDPGVFADKTVAGIDVNNNGIRDDVELAIFEKYPKSAKTRAVLLQYALALQMEVLQPEVNTVLATEVIREQSRAHTCIGDILVPRKDPESSRENSDVEKIYEYINFIETTQFNTVEREKTRESFFDKLRSFGDLDNEACDIDVSTFLN